MATYALKGKMSLEFEDIEIEANSEEEAVRKLWEMSAAEIVKDGIVADSTIEDEEVELVEAEFTVHVTAVGHDVDYPSCCEIAAREHPELDEDSEELDRLAYEKRAEIKKSLPQEFDFRVWCEKDELDEYVAERVSDETGWAVDWVDYQIESIK